jgi:hypothetical protein
MLSFGMLVIVPVFVLMIVFISVFFAVIVIVLVSGVFVIVGRICFGPPVATNCCKENCGIQDRAQAEHVTDRHEWLPNRWLRDGSSSERRPLVQLANIRPAGQFTQSDCMSSQFESARLPAMACVELTPAVAWIRPAC